MHSRSYLLAAAALLFLPATAFAQTTISGRVQGEDRAAVPDVAVTIPELGLGTVTRDDGRYSITVPGARVLGQTVTVAARRIGYRAQNVRVTLNPGTIATDITLAANPMQLGEVIVTGAGTTSTVERLGNVRNVVSTLADDDSVLELRAAYAPGMITALVRIAGRPFGLIANNPLHLGGAIDGPGADKSSRFMQLCDAFDLPMISLCDTPGFNVGPEVERTGQVRRVSRMFVTAASMTVPVFFVALRKGYGLGAQAMAAGSLHEPFFSVAWPTGEFGPMGLEGAVRLGYRKELAAIENPQERQAAFDAMVAQSYAQGKALHVASVGELDAVIDPRDTRDWIVRGLRAIPAPPARTGKKRPSIDTW